MMRDISGQIAASITNAKETRKKIHQAEISAQLKKVISAKKHSRRHQLQGNKEVGLKDKDLIELKEGKLARIPDFKEIKKARKAIESPRL